MISVCIASYNGEKFIKQLLESIIPQLSMTDEIIISDDNSSDNTVQIIKKIIDKSAVPIFLKFNNGRRGFVSNFNNALIFARGDYVFLSDQDDIWLENKIKEYRKYFNLYHLIIGNAYVNCNLLKNHNEKYFDTKNTNKNSISILYKNPFAGTTFAMSKSLVSQICPIPLVNKVPFHDWLIVLYASLRFNIFIIKKPTMIYRRHDNNLTNFYKSDNSNLKMLTNRFYILIATIIIFFRNGKIK